MAVRTVEHVTVVSSYKKPPVKDFATITPKTPLEELNLNWRERDLPEKVRTKHVHRLHPYLGKYIPQLVEVFLRKYRPTLVYDPFCGSGTTLVEANTLGIDSIGCDVSQFNVLLSRVKTAKYDLGKLKSEIQDILFETSKLRKGTLFGIDTFDRLGPESEYLKEWYADRSRKELLYYRELIANYHYKDLMRVILSRAARSARLTTHYDLDFPKKPQTEPYYCYKHGRTCKPVEEAYKFLARYTEDTYRRVAEFAAIRTKADVDVRWTDSRGVDLPKGIDCVITSPPYFGLIDYHEQHKYAYELLNLSRSDEEEIGAASNGQSQKARQQYIEGINEVLAHTRKHLKRNAVLVIVINDKFELYDPKPLGYKWEARMQRHVNRRTGRRSGAFYEDIFIWRKP